MENTDELEKLIEESPYGDFVSSTDKTIYLLQRMSLSLKGAAISLFRLQGTAKGSLEPLHYLKQTQEFLFSFHLNSLALAKKVGLPSSEEEQDATVYPSLVIFSQARALTPEFALLRGRVISYLRRPTSDMYLLLETAIHRIHQTVVRLQTEIASAMADPLTLNVVNADEARGSKCYLETGARTSVAVRPVLSFGYAYGLEAIKHESDVQTMWDLAKQAAHSLSQITHTATLNDHRKELNEIQGRSRIWEMLLRMVRAHANGRRSADDKHLLLEAAAETRLAFSELWQTEIRCCQTGSYSGSVARLTQLAQKLASVSEKMFREILAVRTRESKISSKTEASLWEEAEQEGVNIIYDKTSKVKKIKSASLNRLIVRVTDTKVPDPQLTKAFLRTYSNFCTPAKLLEKLIERYEVPTDKNAREGLTRTEHHKTIVQPIQARVYNFLKSWIDSQFGEDFDHALLTRLNNFLENKMMRDGNERLAKALISRISKELRELMASNIEKPLAPVEHADDFLLELPEQVFAEQITARFFDIYRKIKPVELLGLAWSKEKLRHRAPNVTYMISEFNRYSAWLQTRIVSQTHLRQRAKVYGKILRVALILRELQNFDTLIDMIAVTNSSAIRRLVHTKEAAGAKLVADFDRMKEQVTGGRNWANYREIVRSSKTPLLPYLGTYLTDLTFIDEGNKDFSAGLINFGKSLLIYNVLSDIEQYQRDPFVFAPDPNIQAAWDQATIESETAIFARSSKVEPKGANKMDLLQ